MTLLELLELYQSIPGADTHYRELIGEMIKRRQIADLELEVVDHKINQGVNANVASGKASAVAIKASKAQDKAIIDEVRALERSIKLDRSDDIGRLLKSATFVQMCETSLMADQILKSVKYKLELDKLSKGLDDFFDGDYSANAHKLSEVIRARFSKGIKYPSFNSIKNYLYVNHILPNIPAWILLDSVKQQELLQTSNNVSDIIKKL